MKQLRKIVWKNITKRPVRSLAMIFLAAVLSLSVFAGTIVVSALRNGFHSLEDRLGADIMVVPYEAITKEDLKGMILQGNTGYFYMDAKYLDEISKMEGIANISPQYYLASVKAGCCSLPVEIVGYDPETDFTITPWIKRSNGGEVGYRDVVVGNDLNAFVGDTLSFFGENVHVVAKLDKTGTAYDTQVFTTKETIRTLIDASLNKQLNQYANIHSGNVISCILINVADGYDVDDVMGEINIHNKKLRAVRTTNMISGISDSLAAVSDVAGMITVIVWVVALVIMIVAFVMMTGERKKEFGILRVMGASKKKLSALVLMEGIGLSLVGSLVGVCLGAVILLPFSGYIEMKLSIPFLLPHIGFILLIGGVAVLLTILAGSITAGISAFRIAKIDTGAILRSGE